MASARLQRWALTLGAYNYSIRYKPGNSHNNADMLSRLPLPESPPDIPLPGERILLLEQLQSSPITAAQIKQPRPCSVKSEELCIKRLAITCWGTDNTIPSMQRRAEHTRWMSSERQQSSGTTSRKTSCA